MSHQTVERVENPSESTEVATPGRVRQRTSVFLRSEVETPRAQTQGNVRNLSATGARLDLPVQLDIGDPIYITIRNIGRVAGKVIWTRGGQVGVHFDREINPDAAYPARRTTTTETELFPVQTDCRRPGLSRVVRS